MEEKKEAEMMETNSLKLNESFPRMVSVGTDGIPEWISNDHKREWIDEIKGRIADGVQYPMEKIEINDNPENPRIWLDELSYPCMELILHGINVGHGKPRFGACIFDPFKVDINDMIETINIQLRIASNSDSK
jgi:hypothetical protein